MLETAVSLALNPNEGTPFEFGGRPFTLQFLTCDGEERLVNLLTPRIKDMVEAGNASHQQVMTAINDLLPQSVGIILGDYTFAGGDPKAYDAHIATTTAWVRSVRQPRGRLAMYDLVAAQFEVNDMGKLLAGLLQADAALSAVDRAQTSSTPAT
jgi:hypothetical protein